LGKVSVVMMPRPARAQASASSPFSISGSLATIFLSSSTTPITPVEASITSRWRQPKRLATSEAVRRAASAPALPVKALAQPALITRARTSLPPSAPARCFLHQSTGAEPILWRVKTPAQLVPRANRNTTRSSRSCL
jgi:hypothetical protein